MVLDSFFDRFWGVWGGLGGPLESTWVRFGSTWSRFERTLRSLWLILGALESHRGESGATLGSLGGDFGVRGLMYITFVQNVQILSRNCTLFCTWVEQSRIVFGKLSSFQRASRSLAKTGLSGSSKT